MNKKCTKCEEVKLLVCFNNDKYSKDGKASTCKQCKAQHRKDNPDLYAKYRKKWYDSNKEYVHTEKKKYRAENKGKIKEESKDYYASNRDRILEKTSEYRKAHPHKAAASTARRRAKQKQATPIWATSEQEQALIQELYKLSRVICNISGVEHHVDHIVPLCSEFVCGLHCSANLQILPGRDNISKSNRYWPDMWATE